MRVADRLINFSKRFGAFIILQLADYYTYGLKDLLLFLVCYTGPPGFSAIEVEATGATEAVLGLLRVGGTIPPEPRCPGGASSGPY